MWKKKFVIFGLMGVSLFGFFISIQTAQASLWGFWKETDQQFISCNQERKELAAEYAVWDYDCSAEKNNILEKRLRDSYKQSDGLLGYSVVSRYKTTLSAPMTTTQTSVPVASVATFDGHTLVMSDIGSVIFLTIEPGSSKEEIVKCTTISGTSWATCTRGLAFYGTSESAVTANQKTHSAGSVVVMSNVHYVYEQLVDKDTSETASGTKRFASDELIFGDGTATNKKKLYFCDSVSTSTCGYLYATPSTTSAGALDFGFSVDGTDELGLNSAGTTVGASSTKAMFLTNSLFGINASSTLGMAFGDDGYLYQKVYGGLAQNTTGIYVGTSEAFTWSGLHTFSVTTTMATTTMTSSTINNLNISTGLNINTQTTSTLPKINTDYISNGATTTFYNNVQINGNLGVDGLSSESNYEIKTNTGTGPTTNNTQASVTATCTAGKRVVGGGGKDSLTDGVTPVLEASYPATTSTWTITFGANGTTGANTMTVYAICIK